MNKQRITLHPGRDKSLRQGHPWIFSGAVATGAAGTEGEILPVYSAEGKFLAHAYFHCKSSIIGRVITFEERPPLEAVAEHIKKAYLLRQVLFKGSTTNCYRLINGEADMLPGLIVDCYGPMCVVQVATLGMQKLLPFVVETLITLLKPTVIYEKSHSPSRAEEGLPPQSGYLYGPITPEVEVVEEGMRFWVNPEEGQKTGFFLDQREMRQLVRRYSAGHKVVNLFSYTGAFSVAALQGGATHVTSVDRSVYAIAQAERHMASNGFAAEKHTGVVADVFTYLRGDVPEAKFWILDPPALVKRKKDQIAGCRAYKDLNRQLFLRAPPGSFVLTCSCSHFVDDLLFQKVVFQASMEAHRSVRILSHHRDALDHPTHLCHPEAHYLKSLFLYVE